MRDAAALAATAALFHVFNHAIFKSLLFFGAGAVLNATGERNIEKLGGLIHRMPHTAFAFLVGCVAISALPPLNGFVSEWLTVPGDPAQPGAAALGPEIHRAGRRARCSRCRRRSRRRASCARSASPSSAARARRSPSARGRSTAFRSPRCSRSRGSASLVGILPGLVIDGLAPVVQGLVGARMPVQLSSPWLSIVPVIESRSSYNGLLVFLFALADRVAHRLRDPSRRFRRDPPRSAVGLRLSRSEPAHAVFRRQLRPADPPRVRHGGVPRERTGRDAAAVRSAPGATDRAGARPDLRLALRAGRARRARSRPTGSTTSSSSPSAAI